MPHNTVGGVNAVIHADHNRYAMAGIGLQPQRCPTIVRMTVFDLSRHCGNAVIRPSLANVCRLLTADLLDRVLFSSARVLRKVQYPTFHQGDLLHPIVFVDRTLIASRHRSNRSKRKVFRCQNQESERSDTADIFASSTKRNKHLIPVTASIQASLWEPAHQTPDHSRWRSFRLSRRRSR